MTTNRRQLGFQGLAQHVARLRQRAFAGIDQQHHAVDHLERAFHFAAKIAVAGGVDDIDLYVVIEDGGVFGQDGDAALALQLVGVHDAFDHGARWRGRCRFGCSMASTSVVLPWSTCAMMAILRMFEVKSQLPS